MVPTFWDIPLVYCMVGTYGVMSIFTHLAVPQETQTFAGVRRENFLHTPHCADDHHESFLTLKLFSRPHGDVTIALLLEVPPQLEHLFPIGRDDANVTLLDWFIIESFRLQ